LLDQLEIRRDPGPAVQVKLDHSASKSPAADGVYLSSYLAQ
jgi:hypothetical protein